VVDEKEEAEGRTVGCEQLLCVRQAAGMEIEGGSSGFGDGGFSCGIRRWGGGSSSAAPLGPDGASAARRRRQQVGERQWRGGKAT
jgi:hypothetical protein